MRTPLTETLAEYFHTFRNADLLIDGFQTILLRNWTYFERSERPPGAVRAPRGAGAQAARRRRSRTPSSRSCCASCSCGARRPSTGRTATNTTTACRPSAKSWPGCSAGSPSLPGAGHAAARPGRTAPPSGPPSRPSSSTLPLAAAARLSPGRRAPRHPRVGGRAGGRAHRRGAVAERFGFLAKKRLSALVRRAKAAPDDGAALGRASHLLRHPRARHRPGLPRREPRGPLRRLPLLAQRRHARLPPERGHGRPAGRGQADAAPGTSTWTWR